MTNKSWPDRPVTLSAELRDMWLEYRGPLAMGARRRLLRAVLVAGSVAVLANRAANTLERWIP